MTNKIAFAFAFFFVMHLNAWSQNTTLNGNIKGIKQEKVFIQYNIGKKLQVDSVKVTNGKFIWKGNIDEPQRVTLLFTQMMRYPIYIESGLITVSGIADSLQSFVVKGSTVNDEFISYQKSMDDIRNKIRALYLQKKQAGEGEQSEIDRKIAAVRDEADHRNEQYIKKHPSSIISIELVADHGDFGYDYAEVKKIYDLLSEKAKLSARGQRVADRLNILKRSALGEQIYNFKQKDTSGIEVNYSQFTGKYVLLDFWASWCGPCRAENPNVLNQYNIYKGKNFTVIGVSLDVKEADWKRAIRDDHLPWTQLADLKGWGNEIARYLGIQSVPSNFLIDPTGKIIGRNLRGKKLQEKLAEILN